MKNQYSRTPGLLQNDLYVASMVCDVLAKNERLTGSGFFYCLGKDFISDGALGTNQDDDIIDFIDEDDNALQPKIALHPWKILIADDDSNVHDTTLLALSDVKIHGRPLEFVHAYSAREARAIITANQDIALVLLDVVMETVDAGLKLVNIIRNEMGLTNLRIVLRTGQPGYAPEQQVSEALAIDGYTTKSKLTRSLLISVLNDTLANSYDNPELSN
ncbi:response regulator [Undibacterium sp. TJN19]|uniref:response regulator n=1 Tax=Undibacterium sp. TJN19 TaxID=3413055 RepID=UPI003BF26A72